ncbi:MAG: monofunctional biosynthetic peptidoglycan transglycosylase [Bacteroidota bacterium]
MARIFSKLFKKKSKPKTVRGKIWRWMKRLAIFFFASTLFFSVLYTWVNPPFTPLMIIRSVQQMFSGDEVRLKKDWVSIEDISPYMIQAVITSEDQNFTSHNGFDFKAIQKVYKMNQDGKGNMRGGSTISQQTAKNVFVEPSRTWIRKGLETYFTFLTELFWSKKRIMEVYLNVVELGNGIYGVEAASQFYYHKSCRKLSKYEAASLAALLPAPRHWNPLKPTPKLKRHINWIVGHMSGFSAKL